MDCSPPGSSVHGILQARVLEWVAMPSSRGVFPTQGSNLPSLISLLLWQAGSFSPHLPLLPLQLPHHSTSSTQGNPSLPRQVLGFSQGFIFSRLPSLQHIFLPHLFAPSPLSSVQFSSVAQLCLTLSDPMNRSTPGLPVHHQLLESTQTHVH